VCGIHRSLRKITVDHLPGHERRGRMDYYSSPSRDLRPDRWGPSNVGCKVVVRTNPIATELHVVVLAQCNGVGTRASNVLNHPERRIAQMVHDITNPQFTGLGYLLRGDISSGPCITGCQRWSCRPSATTREIGLIVVGAVSKRVTTILTTIVKSLHCLGYRL